MKAFDFFYDILKGETKDYHNMSTDEHLYLTVFLEKNILSNNFFKEEDNKLVKPTLAFLLKDAIDEENERSRLTKFKHLGDCALYTIGVFPLSLQRSLVGVDYFQEMGSRAYYQAYQLNQDPVFKKMAHNFVNLTDLLNLSMALKIKPLSPGDMFHMWSITQSQGLKNKLIESGINPQTFNKLLL